MDQNQGIKPVTWVIVAIIVIILIVLGIYMFGGKSAAPTTTEQPVTETPSDVTAAAANRIVVSDQFPGNIVYLSSVQLANGGWVVIHKDAAGTPGAVIGYQWFEKGINPGKITLTEKTVEGGSYYAMIHTDDGDKKFDIKKDLPLKDANGNIIMKMFKATATATEVKG
ncbi:MAG: hypothetical protein JWO73_73 [Candidatus Taylorbacteria bacterium]|nr:hypothetical protein [Candidatus Taylorbacteria bacterium]